MMSKREFTAIILKLLGIYCLIQSLPALRYSIGIVFEYSQGAREGVFDPVLAFVFGGAIPLLIMLLVSYLLLFHADNLAKILIKKDGGMDITADVRPEELQAIGFSIVAVAILLSTIPRLTNAIVTFYYYLTSGESQSTWTAILNNTWNSTISVTIQITLAIILFFRARGLANFWKRRQIVRHGNFEDDPEEP